jgi:hypothetical protein
MRLKPDIRNGTRHPRAQECTAKPSKISINFPPTPLYFCHFLRLVVTRTTPLHLFPVVRALSRAVRGCGWPSCRFGTRCRPFGFHLTMDVSTRNLLTLTSQDRCKISSSISQTSLLFFPFRDCGAAHVFVAMPISASETVQKTRLKGPFQPLLSAFSARRKPYQYVTCSRASGMWERRRSLFHHHESQEWNIVTGIFWANSVYL